MTIDQFFINQQLLSWAIKAFGIVFALIYLIYSIAIYQQVKLMRRTMGTTLGKYLNSICFFEIMLAIFIFIWAIFLL